MEERNVIGESIVVHVIFARTSQIKKMVCVCTNATRKYIVTSKYVEFSLARDSFALLQYGPSNFETRKKMIDFNEQFLFVIFFFCFLNNQEKGKW